jgi:ribosomal-protein-alanine N-acetyltransferase
MQYRLYTPDDFDALYAIEESCFDPPFRFSRRQMRTLVRRSGSAVWLAESDEGLTGFAIVEWAKRADGVSAYIQTIEVIPQARSRGVGRELLRRIEDSALMAGALWIRLHVDAENPDAIRLYETHGYRCEGRKENFYPLGRAALIYVKALDSCVGMIDPPHQG